MVRNAKIMTALRLLQIDLTVNIEGAATVAFGATPTSRAHGTLARRITGQLSQSQQRQRQAV